MNLSELSSALEPINLRSCLITQNDRMLFEHYRNSSIPAEIAKINSCTKSILSALICIAMDLEIIPGPHTKVTEFFPQLLADSDPRKREITLEHLLTMTSGIDWTEFGGQKSFPRMTRSDDWVDFVLKQPMEGSPGTRMEYSSGVSQLLSAILVQRSGMSTARFAEEHLFSPLGSLTISGRPTTRHSYRRIRLVAASSGHAQLRTVIPAAGTLGTTAADFQSPCDSFRAAIHPGKFAEFMFLRLALVDRKR